MQALQAENRSYKEHNRELLEEQSKIQYALQVETARQRGHAADDESSISTITDAMSRMEQRLNSSIDGKLAAFNANISGSSNTTLTSETTDNDRANKLRVAQDRRPDAYKNINGGRGKQFMFYCWNDGPGCGVNCTHNTDRCYALSKEDKLKYKDAIYCVRMGGRERNLTHFGRFQRDYNFDSL